jgi:D-glycero-alpha-D-manno-heptose 1-phosphate guanylyltransferase
MADDQHRPSATEAIVLAGGLGTRLREVVPHMPKPLALVAGRPFLAWILDQLVEAGIARVILAVGYRHELVGECFGRSFGPLQIDYAVEDRPLGTGGAIRNALRASATADVFVLNGDSFVSVDLPAMYAAHDAADVSLSMVIARVDDTARYGGVIVAGDRVTGFSEKRSSGGGMINAGVYLLDRRLFDAFSLPESFSFEKDILAARAGELRPLAFPAEGSFIDIGVPEDYMRAQRMFAAGT